MGIESRDYFRDASRNAGGIGGAGSAWPPVCRFILIANIVVFLLQIFYTRPPSAEAFMETFRDLPPEEQPRSEEIHAILENAPRISVVEEWFQLDTEKVMGGQIWRPVTCAFLHDRFSLWHIIVNMLLLVWFGKTLERMYGSREFLFFYLTAAFAASLAYMALDLFTGEMVPAIGASGAVMGVVMLYAMHFPREEIRLWFFWPIQIRWLVLFYLIYDLHPVVLALTGEKMFTGIAHAAHLGGLAFGFFYRKLDRRIENLFGRGSARKKKPKVSIRIRPRDGVRRKASQKPAAGTGDPIDGRIDELLEKISNEGFQSLSTDEKAFLERASEHYRDRDEGP